MRRARALGIFIIAATTAATVIAVASRGGLGAESPSFGVSDCEAMHAGALAQPVNAWSALALVAAGMWIAATAVPRHLWRDPILAASASVAGLASYTAHATASDLGARLDAAGVTLVLVAVAAACMPTRSPVVFGGSVLGLAGVVAWAPGVLEASAAIAAAAALVALTLTHRGSGRQARTAVPMAAAGAVGVGLWALGRTGAPWCDPAGLLQPHAAWHVAAAIAVVLGVHFLRSSDHPQSDGANTLRSQTPGERDEAP